MRRQFGTQLQLYDPRARCVLGSYREEKDARLQAESRLAEEQRRVAELEARLRELEGHQP